MKCPGQDTRYWKPGAIFQAKCPNCGYDVEFFKDESTRRCKNCGNKLVNPRMDFGCAAYCEFTEQCLGELPPELLDQRDDLFRDRVAIEMKRYFGRDFNRITHATRVARYAEKIVKEEKGDLAIVLSAAYLHDVGARGAKAKRHGPEPQNQDQKGSTVAREILTRLGARENLVEEVCDIIGRRHHPTTKETINFKVVYDADAIAKLEEKQKASRMPTDSLAAAIDKSLLTKTGREMARTVLLNSHIET
jgi:HD superfamily phosphodiesterase